MAGQSSDPDGISVQSNHFGLLNKNDFENRKKKIVFQDLKEECENQIIRKTNSSMNVSTVESLIENT